jgi:hypothetical protein
VAREDDFRRQALLEEHGVRVLRVTWEQAVKRPSETLARLRGRRPIGRRASVDCLRFSMSQSTLAADESA